MRKWLVSLVLALAVLFCAGVAQAEGTVTITYDKESVNAGEAVTAHYVIEGVDYKDVRLYWRVNMEDQEGEDRFNYWNTNDLVLTGQSGTVSIDTFSKGSVTLMSRVYGIKAVYAKGSTVFVDSSGSYFPLTVTTTSDRQTAAPGSTITAQYALESVGDGVSITFNPFFVQWEWYDVNKQFIRSTSGDKIRTTSGSVSLTIPEDYPSGAQSVRLKIMGDGKFADGSYVYASFRSPWSVALTSSPAPTATLVPTETPAPQPTEAPQEPQTPKITISYEKTNVAVGEEIKAYYSIEGMDYSGVKLYWKMALTDNDTVKAGFPKVTYINVVYWEALNDYTAEAAEGSVSVVKAVGAGCARLCVRNDDGVDVVYQQGSDIVEISGEAYKPYEGTVQLDKETVKLGETITARYTVSDDAKSVAVGYWYWLNGDRGYPDELAAYELTQAATGEYTLTVPQAVPADVDGIAFEMFIHYDNGYYVYYSNSAKVVTRSDVSGLTLDADGVFRLYKNGALDTDYYGIYNYNGGRFFIANGTIVPLSGLVSDEVNWYYLANGQVADYTGLALYDGAWFYVTNGILDTVKAGIVTYDGREFMIAAGRILTEVDGMIQEPNTGEWYYVAAGQVTDFTGLVEYGGAWFWVNRGKLATDMTGAYEYNGTTIQLVGGQLM